MKHMVLPVGLLAAAILSLSCSNSATHAIATSPGGNQMQPMQLGNFSVSLTVKNIEVSRQFYEKLGFTKFMGDPSQGWLILRNGAATIGLFQGVFERNLLTFNPGWDANAQPLGTFTDVRELQRRLKAQGIAITTEADEKTTGPASFMITDPDGNPILFDQHR